MFDSCILEMVPTYPHALYYTPKALTSSAMTLPCYNIFMWNIVDLQTARNALKLGE